MFSLSLLFTIFGLVLSVERPSNDATSLLGMIRNNPNALVTMFETADKTKVDTIIKLLGGLINEAKDEIRNINDADAKCAKAVQNAADVWAQKISEEAAAKTDYENAQKLTARAEGNLKQIQSIYDAESPRLKKEMEIFRKVINILNGIMANDKRNGINLSEEDATEVSAFISLADQADPVKVKKILDLLNKLFAESSKELGDLTATLNKARDYLKECELAEEKALGRYTAAKAATVACKRDYDRLVGQCALRKKAGAARKNILFGEMKTLLEVIDLLKGINA